MSIRLSFTIESANTTINIPTEPVSGEWRTLKVLKCYHNVNANTTGTNKAMFLNIDECENDGFINSSSGKLVRYAYTYLCGQDGSVDEYRNYPNTPTIHFKNTKTDKLTISVSNITGAAPSSSDLGSTRYMILEVELNCGHKLSY